MAVVATRTSENINVIDEKNGVLVGETANDFYKGLSAIFEKRTSFDSHEIRSMASGHTWEIITKENLRPYLQKICRQ